MKCFTCDKTLEKLWESDDNTTPLKASSFRTHQSAGSEAFRPIGPEPAYLVIHVCDECLEKNGSKVTIFNPPLIHPVREPDRASPWKDEQELEDFRKFMGER